MTVGALPINTSSINTVANPLAKLSAGTGTNPIAPNLGVTAGAAPGGGGPISQQLKNKPRQPLSFTLTI
jgi:hypothetical protein